MLGRQATTFREDLTGQIILICDVKHDARGTWHFKGRCHPTKTRAHSLMMERNWYVKAGYPGIYCIRHFPVNFMRPFLDFDILCILYRLRSEILFGKSSNFLILHESLENKWYWIVLWIFYYALKSYYSFSPILLKYYFEHKRMIV